MEALPEKMVQEELSLAQQEILYESYYRNVYYTVYRFCKDRGLAEELTNEAYVVAFQKICMLKDMGKFRGWICTIALNLAKDYMRKNNRISSVASMELWTQSCNTLEDEVVEKLDRNQVKAAINGLDSHYRNVIILRYYHELPYNDIAKRLNLSCSAVKTRINRAKGKLHLLLGPKGQKQELPA